MENFEIPEDWVGKNITIKLNIPLVNQGGFGLPEIRCVLRKKLQGALLIQIDGKIDQVLAMTRIFAIERPSDLTMVASA
ncbi:MAG: hypothetical protein EBS90_08035 [Betaproteobacteria bacterium]|nr:hypothetical protein [Betaproteobacteria bacterium]